MALKPWASLDFIASNFFRDGGRDPDTAEITYSFPTTRPSGYSALSGEGKTFTTFGLEQRSWAAAAMEAWEEVIDIDFINTGSGGGGDIRLMNTRTHDGGSAHTKDNRRDIWVHADDVSNFNLGYGTFGFGTLIHEIGHALGFEHPGNYNASDGPSNYEDDAPYYQDSLQYTVMSYFGADETGADHVVGGFTIDVQTPLLHDIWAVQQRFGANMQTRTGNTIYGFGANTSNPVYDFDVNPIPVLAIWDAGGIDELSLSGAENAVRIDLRQGHFSDALGMSDNIAIAYGVTIENARGGEGGDTVIGNEVGNTLRGLDGFDKLYGKEGNDKLYGGDDGDYLYGDEQNDTAYGGNGNDRLFGEDGNDDLHGDTNDDSLYGWGGADVLNGDAGNDYLSGNTGLDIFFGGSGRDTVSFLYSDSNWLVELDPDNTAPYAAANGSAELVHSIEAIEFGDGNDTAYGSDTHNRLQGNDGNDRLYGYGGNDTLEGGDGHDRFYRASGDNRLDGGAGIDTIHYGQTEFAINVDLHNQFSSQKVVDRPGSSNDQFDKLSGIEILYATVHNDTVKGATSMNNTIDGNSGDDELWGRGGNNSLFGGYGDDTFLSGTGNDTLSGGIGVDAVTYELGSQGVSVNLALLGNQAIAGFGVDRLVSIENLTGTGHADWLHGNSGLNTILGGNGADRIFGWHGSDTLAGDVGNDTLDGGLGNDSMSGGDGNDVLTPAWGDDVVDGGTGFDTVNYADAFFGGVNVDLGVTSYQEVGGGEGEDRILYVESAVGSNGFNDTLRGTDATNKLYGLGGNDLIEARGGNDIIDGGMGYDTASFESSSVGVTVDLGNGGLPQNTQAGIDSFISIEALKGSAFTDILLGDVVGNRLYGEAGDDLLWGAQGHDWLDGGLGNDLLFGGEGNDTIVGNSGSDTVSYLFSTAGVTVVLTTSLQTTGGAGNDHVLSVENIDGSMFADSLGGSQIANHINAYDGNDTLYGYNGNDTLRGGGGADTLSGGIGDDLLFGGTSGDYLNGGEGIDTASYGTAASGVHADLEQVSLNSGDALGDVYVGVENLSGSDFADTLTGSIEANRIEGGWGADHLAGRQGQDTLRGGVGADVLEGGAQADDLYGEQNADSLDGAGDHDLLDGGAANDSLMGGLGSDTQTGGGGADRFVFLDVAESAPGALRDTITDFSSAEADRIDLSAIDARTNVGGNQAFTFVGSAAFSGTSGELRFAAQVGGIAVQADTDGNGAADMAIYLTGVNAVAAGDFVL